MSRPKARLSSRRISLNTRFISARISACWQCLHVCFLYVLTRRAIHNQPIQDRLAAIGVQRTCAVAMAAIAAILTLGIGRGSALLQSLAIAIEARLIIQVPLTLAALKSLVFLYRGRLVAERGAGADSGSTGALPRTKTDSDCDPRMVVGDRQFGVVQASNRCRERQAQPRPRQ